MSWFFIQALSFILLIQFWKLNEGRLLNINGYTTQSSLLVDSTWRRLQDKLCIFTTETHSKYYLN